MKEKIQLYIDKVYNLETNKRGFTIILRFVETGTAFQLTNQFDTMDEAQAALNDCAKRKSAKFDVEIVNKKII
ncbi:MAG: hypothetical protein J5598_00650 [Clostridia bacterium]|nr:hypothetical protein [Clostridia bacterium]